MSSLARAKNVWWSETHQSNKAGDGSASTGRADDVDRVVFPLRAANLLTARLLNHRRRQVYAHPIESPPLQHQFFLPLLLLLDRSRVRVLLRFVIRSPRDLDRRRRVRRFLRRRLGLAKVRRDVEAREGRVVSVFGLGEAGIVVGLEGGVGRGESEGGGSTVRSEVGARFRVGCLHTRQLRSTVLG